MKSGNITDRIKGEQSPLSGRVRRLLPAFCIMMLLLTVLSRAADSVTIARITTGSPKGSVLTFTAEGEGVVTGEARKYIAIPQGLGIDQIHTAPGEEVKKGDVLLTVNRKDLQTMLEEAETETSKLTNQIKQEQDTVLDTTLSTEEKAEILYETAKAELEDSKEDLEEAREVSKQAQNEKEEARRNYEKACSKNSDDIYKEKKAEYNAARLSYSNTKLSCEDSFATAQGAWEEAKEKLAALQNKDGRILTGLEQYCSYYKTDSERAREGMEELFLLAYGDDRDAYEEHKAQVNVLEKKLARANDDVYRAEDYEAARRAWEDAKAELEAAKKKETVLTVKAEIYRSTGSEAEKEKAFLHINQCIYGVNGYGNHKKELAKTETKVKQLEASMLLVQERNRLALEAEQEKVNQLKKTVERIQDGSYGFGEIAAAQKQELDTAEQAVKTAKAEVKRAKRANEAARRSFVTAKLDYQQSKQQTGLTREARARQESAMKLRIQAVELELEQKKKVFDELNELYQRKGQVLATEQGIVDQITMEEGKKAAADSNISINTGKCGILVTVPREEGEYVSIGDEMELLARGKAEPVRVKVEGIRFLTEENGKNGTELSAILPDGSYIPGATMAAEITKNSELYERCIPITAVREDGQGSYCLVVQERNTILGKELHAVRMGIKIIEKDAFMAAVESSLTEQDDIVLSSNKNIGEGDRVRMNGGDNYEQE